MKPKLFIGSSVEGLPFANALQSQLIREAHVRVWTQGIFRSGNYPMDDLIAIISDSDFAVFVFLPDDIAIIRGVQHSVVRDNLLLELGMFIGSIGRKRAIFAKPLGADLHLPTDLMGIKASEFDYEDKNHRAAMGSVSLDVTEMLRELGPQSKPGTVRAMEASYDREATRAAMLAQSGQTPLLRGQKYTRNDVITPEGDVRILEKWENMKSYDGKAISEMRVRFKSRSGRQASYRCESLTPNQSVTWSIHLVDGEICETTFVFDPPIGHAAPISFRTERYIFNGISFSKQDRLETTNYKEAEEDAELAFRNIYDSCTFQIKFPEHRFPNQCRVSATRMDGESVVAEEQLARRGLDLLAETQNLVLRLENPLFGVRYRVIWELPEVSGAIFPAITQAFVDEVTRRLLGLRQKTNCTDGLQDALDAARSRLCAATGIDESENIAVVTYVYDRPRAALICVATLNAAIIEGHWEKHLFKPGRGVVGKAFKKRSCEIYIHKQCDPGMDVYESVISGEEAVHPDVIVCVPLFYPGFPNRALAVLSFEFKNPDQAAAQSLAEAAAPGCIQRAFEQWYVSDLAPAVGQKASNVYWEVSGT